MLLFRTCICNLTFLRENKVQNIAFRSAFEIHYLSASKIITSLPKATVCHSVEEGIQKVPATDTASGKCKFPESRTKE